MNLFYGLKLALRGLSCLKSLSLSFSCLRGDQMHELFTALAKEDSKVDPNMLVFCLRPCESLASRNLDVTFEFL